MDMRIRTGRHPRRAPALALASALAWGCGPNNPTDTDDGSSTAQTSTGEPNTGSSTVIPPTSEPTSTDPTTGTTAPETGTDTAVTTVDTDTDTTATTETGTTGPEETLACVPGPTVQRRLTATQLRNTFGDLLIGVQLPKINLPPDPSSPDGFDNAADIQPPWDDVAPTYAAAAQVVAGAAVVQSELFLPCPPDGGPDPAACGHEFIDVFGPRALRRPLADEEKTGLVAAFDAELADGGFQAAIQITLAAIFQSEPFLHLIEVGGAPVEGHPEVLTLTGFEQAARLSYFLWNTTPDDQLLAAAADGTLDTKEGVESEARRLLMEPRARDTVARYALKWLHLHALEKGGDLPQSIPMALQESLRREIERVVHHVVFDGERTLASLLSTNVSFLDAQLATIYNVDPPAVDFEMTELDPMQRPGVLTRAGWLAARSLDVEHHSPFVRGWRLLDSLLCLQLPPPPPDVPLDPPEFPADQTTRQVYEALVAEPTCGGCHNPAQNIGYGLENYDFLGTWRDMENGLPVDASGEIDASVDPASAGPFMGAAALMQALSESETVHACAARKAYGYALGRLLSDADTCDVDLLKDAFLAAGGDLQELLVQIAISDGFRHRLAP